MMRTVRHTLRNLRRTPFFAAVVIGILALGLGATTAVTSIVDTVLLRPLPFSDPERLVVVWESRPQVGPDSYLVTPADFFDWEERAESFQDLAAFTESFFNLSGEEFPVRVPGLMATPDLLRTLGVEPARGRGFTPADAESGAQKVVVVGHGFWQRHLGGATLDAEGGTTVELDGEVATVVGVLPADFLFLGKELDVLSLYLPTPEARANRQAHYLTVVGRLAPGVGLERARAEMESVADRLAQAHQDTNAGHEVRVVPLREELVGSVEPALLVLLLAVGCVLLITCANVANLLLARGATRRQEMAVRAALGADRTVLLRQMMVEGLVMGLLGGAAGLVVAWLGVEALRLLTPVDVPRFDRVGLDWRVFGYALGLSVLTGLAVSLFPALGASRVDLVRSLGSAGRSQGKAAAGRWLRAGLVAAEVTLAVVLLIGAGLLLRSFSRLVDEDPGFTTRGLVTLDLTVPWSRLSEGDDPGAFLHRLLERVRQEPGIVAAGATSHLPMSGEEGSRSFSIAGRANPDAEETQTAEYRRISVGYPEVMDVPLLRGRTFTSFDRELPGVALVNRAFAERYFPGGDALGETLYIQDGADQIPREVVGVLGDVRHFGLDETPRPEMYVPMLQIPWPTMSLVVETAGNPESAVRTVRQVLREMDPGLPVANIRTIEESVGRSVATERFSASLLALFAAVAALLAAFGIYGVQSYLAQQLKREMGIRMALGARAGDVLRRVLARGALPVAVGLAAGLALAVAFARLLESQLHQVPALDPWIFVLIPLFLGAVGLLACYLPARRTLRLEPGQLFGE